MKKYKCPVCLVTKFVIRKTKRKSSLLYLCKFCRKYFTVNTIWVNKQEILSDHLDGLSFRDLSRKYDISPMKAWRICEYELKKLPDNNQFTHKYCNRFYKIFLFDGKYFNVTNKSADWVILWGIDYLRHDIPVFTIASAETYQTWARYFSFLRTLNLHPQLLVCDDHIGLKLAARSAFPLARIQTCYNHFKENIRKDLKIRSNKFYKPFMRQIESVLDSSNKLSDETFNHWMFCLLRDYKHDPVTLSVLTNIEKYKTELLAYRNIPQAPLTTNLIEGMNGHLEQRLKSICSFQSVAYAKLWLNGYILKRRMTKFTDCKKRFRYLNGKTGVQMTKNQRLDLPLLF